MDGWIDCKHIFSNGSEYEMFMACQCWNGCTKYRNGKCRIVHAIELAMWDTSKFPYKDLLDHEKYGGKRCKSYTTEKQIRHRKPKQIEGQIMVELEVV